MCESPSNSKKKFVFKKNKNPAKNQIFFKKKKAQKMRKTPIKSFKKNRKTSDKNIKKMKVIKSHQNRRQNNSFKIPNRKKFPRESRKNTSFKIMP